MSSATETTASPGSQKGGFWAPISPVIIQLTAATAGITATFPLFVAKTAKQLGQPNPMMSVMQAFRAGAATAPNMGAIIATQLIAKRGVEKLFSKQEEGKASFSSMFLSAAIVGAISAPPLAIFNGQTMGRSAWQSVQGLQLRQIGAIVLRETSFLFALGISSPICAWMQQAAGDKDRKWIELPVAFVTGVTSGVVSHPADTALTLWQRKMKIESARQLMQGGFTRAIALGGFFVCYTGATRIIESIAQTKMK